MLEWDGQKEIPFQHYYWILRWKIVRDNNLNRADVMNRRQQIEIYTTVQQNRCELFF